MADMDTISLSAMDTISFSMPQFEEFSSSMNATVSKAAVFTLVAALGLTLIHNPIGYPWGIFSANRRERLLIWLYALGKYSLVDTYALVLTTMVAFRTHLEFKDYTIDLFVTPMSRFYGFLGMTIVSLIMGHVLLSYQRKTSLRKVFPAGGRKESLSHHSYQTSSDDHFWRLTSPFLAAILLLLVGAVTLTFIGIDMEIFQFEIKGLAGIALDEPRRSSYSFLSLGKAIPYLVENPDSFWIRLFQALYYYFGLGMPLTCIASLVILLVWPLYAQSQKLLFTFAEMSNAWSALEVFVVSVFAALLQVSQGSSFMSCEAMKQVFKEYLHSDIPDDDENCFDVTASLSENSRYLFCGTGLYCAVTFVLLRLARQALDERLEHEGIVISRSLTDDGDHDYEDTDGVTRNTFAESLDNFFGGILELDEMGTMGYRDLLLATEDVEATEVMPVVM